MSQPLLQVEHLTILHRDTQNTLVSDISFSLEQAGILTLIGQSGSGKTMTCRAILGILSRRSFQISGKICFDENELTV